MEEVDKLRFQRGMKLLNERLKEINNMKYRELQAIKHALIYYREREDVILKDYMQETMIIVRVVREIIHFLENELRRDKPKHDDKIAKLKGELAKYEIEFQSAVLEYDIDCVLKQKGIIGNARECYTPKEIYEIYRDEKLK